MSTEQLAYLQAILSVIARSSIGKEQVTKLIDLTNERQLIAYNLCDGTLTQQEIAKRAGIDSSNFSKTVARWINEGIIFRIPKDDGRKCLLHVFPVNSASRRTKGRRGKKGE